MQRRIILTRHSKKPDPEDPTYKGLSKSGVALARKSAQDIIQYIIKSPSKSVIFLCGALDEVRTRSTEQIYGEEIKKALSRRPNEYIVITNEDIALENPNQRNDYLKALIDKNPHKKVVVTIPMSIDEFSLRKKGWFTQDGQLTEFSKKLFEKVGNDEQQALRYWLAHQGNVDGLKGPKPIEVAKSYAQGIKRLEAMERWYAGKRPYVTGLVGHSMELDTYLTWVATGGRIDLESYERLNQGGGMIKETELATITSNPVTTSVSYRGKHRIARTLESIAASFAVSSFILAMLAFPGITGNIIGASKSNLIGLSFLLISLISSLLVIHLRKKINLLV